MHIRERLETSRCRAGRRLWFAVPAALVAAVLLFAWAQPVVFSNGWQPPLPVRQLAPRLSLLAPNFWQMAYVAVLTIAVIWPYQEIKHICAISDRLSKAEREAEDHDLRDSFK